MKTCKTCKHWDTATEAGPVFVVLARDELGYVIDHEYRNPNVHPCNAAINIEHSEDDLKRSYLSIPENGMGFDYPVCDVWTGPEFNCSNYEKKDD